MSEGVSERWYLASDELMTDLERKGKVLSPEKVLVVEFNGPLWNHFSSFVSQTSEVVESSFRGGELSYKSRAYSESVPQIGEGAASFFYRNMQKMGATSGMAGEMFQAVSEETSRVDEFKHGHFSTGIYSGDRVLDTEVRKLKRGGRIRTRVVASLNKYNIGFSAGFNGEGQWFWTTGLENRHYRELFDDFSRRLSTIDVVRFMGSPSLERDEKHGTDFVVYS